MTAIRGFWHHRYPQFWQSLQRKVATDTAAALRELTRPARILPDGFITTVSMRQFRPAPEGSAHHLRRPAGPGVSRLGQQPRPHLEGGGVLFGDGLLEQGVGKDLRCGCPRGHRRRRGRLPAGSLGQPAAGPRAVPGGPVHHRCPDDAFRPETLIPILSPDNPPQNWWATDAEALSSSPVVGTTGTTVGLAVEETLHLGAEVSRRLNHFGPGVFEVPG